MKKTLSLVGLAAALAGGATPGSAAADDAQGILARCLAHDPWGMSGAKLDARITLSDKRKATRELAFHAVSRQISPGLSKSLVRFSSPPELKGAGFLQIQKADADDDRFLFLPELKRSRRISGNLRSSAFMGTDFSFSDLDRRDLRDGVATSLGDKTAGGLPCKNLKVTPKRSDSEYSAIEVCVGKDNNLPLEMKMFDRSGQLLKTFHAQAVEKIDQRWFITRSTMTNVKHEHSTVLVLSNIRIAKDVDDSTFTVRELERL